MALNQARNIAVWPTIKAVLQIGWSLRKQHIILSLLITLPLALLITFGISITKHWGLFIAWDLLWLYPVMILWQRLFLMGPELYLKVTGKQLAGIWLRVIIFVLSLLLIGAVIGAACVATWYGLLWIGRHTLGAIDQDLVHLTLAITVFFIVLLVALIGTRLIPAYVSLFVEEKISPQRAWELMRGNTSRSLGVIFSMGFGGMLLAVTSGFIYSGAVRAIYDLELSSPAIHTAIIGAVYLLLGPIQYMGTAALLAAQAIIYRDLVPQAEHLVDVTV